MIPRLRRNAFTLVELLVVLALMSILTGMMTYALSGARQDARVRRAQAEIQAITAILQAKVNEINLRPVQYEPAYEAGPTAGGAVRDGQERNRVAMLARRDTMRMVLPQCRADLIYPPARLQYRKTIRDRDTGNRMAQACAVKARIPSEWVAMRRIAGFVTPAATTIPSLTDPLPLVGSAAFGAIRPVGGGPDVTINLNNQPWGDDLSADANLPWTREHESAECLYLILASTELFGERALDQINSRSIANLDGDNVPEIVDPWGRPYEFIRDGAGFGFPFFGRSVANSTDPSNPPEYPHPGGADANDYLRTDFRFNTTTPLDDTYRITPMVVSAGSDGEFGIRRTFNLRGRVSQGTGGISPRQSIAAVRLVNHGISPVLPLGSYQYPDPFVFVDDLDPNFAVDFNELPDRTIQNWFRGGGLGAPLIQNGRLSEAAADNITSAGAMP